MSISQLCNVFVLAGSLSLLAAIPTAANAAQGCGHGFHRVGWGKCVPNYYRGGYHHRHCWRNMWGHVRCR